MRLLIPFVGLLLLAGRADAADPKPITVGVGEEFEIVLESPPGANRQWLLAKPLDEVRLQQSGRGYRNHPGPNRPRTCEVLRYKAVSKGKAEVHLKYASVFEQQPSAVPTTNFVIVITEPKNESAAKAK